MARAIVNVATGERTVGESQQFFAPPATIRQVKAEAQRRILAICPDWKQRNFAMRAAQLADKGRANWSADEASEWDDMQATWAAINALRAASDRIEAMAPRPSNVKDDALWT